VRLAARASLAAEDLSFSAVVFGAGDWRTRTEERALPPPLAPGDRLALGPLAATVCGELGHPRLVALRFEGDPGAVWAGIARHGRPIQYAYMSEPLALWDVWTPIAALPVAFEPPSAGFALDWRALARLRRRGVGFASITLAAGISSTGDAALDARLPLAEPYCVPAGTATAIRDAKARGGRIIAVGTTSLRLLESAASEDGSIQPFMAETSIFITPGYRFRAVDVLMTNFHLPKSTLFMLVSAFSGLEAMKQAYAHAIANGYRFYSYGDACLLFRAAP
jgi:S-adenosylmethionine:tRNA ribosyltransferase-isomerase